MSRSASGPRVLTGSGAADAGDGRRLDGRAAAAPSVLGEAETRLLTAVALVSAAGPLLLRPDPRPRHSVLLLSSHVIGVVAVTAYGLIIRSRCQLVESLRERAVAAEVEAELRAAQAEYEAREELAREG